MDDKRIDAGNKLTADGVTITGVTADPATFRVKIIREDGVVLLDSHLAELICSQEQIAKLKKDLAFARQAALDMKASFALLSGGKSLKG